MGIGQTSYVAQRYEVADFLSWMYYYEFSIESKRPDPIVTYETLIYPFDNWTWFFAFIQTIAVFVVLIIFQLLWRISSGEPNPQEWLFEGKSHQNHGKILPITKLFTKFMFTDFALTYVVMIDESLPHEWFKRRGYIKARMLILFIWLFFGNVLTMAYRIGFILLEWGFLVESKT